VIRKHFSLRIETDFRLGIKVLDCSLLASSLLGLGSFLVASVGVLSSLLGTAAGSSLLCRRGGLFVAVFFLDFLLGRSAALLRGRGRSWNIFVLILGFDLLGLGGALLGSWCRGLLLLFIFDFVLDLVLLGLGCALLLGWGSSVLVVIIFGALLCLLCLLCPRLLYAWTV
jgi:hypothetical protein